VEQLLKSLLLETHGLLAYGAVFGVLVACGLGLPLPEDISLILGGYLAYHGAASLPVMMFVGFAGILVGDTLIYVAGRRLGTRVGQRPGFFSRIVTPAKRARVEQLFARHGQKIVMVARFLPGVRAVTYFTAGSARMTYIRFILWDGLAALVSAPLFVYLGYRFGGELDWLVERLQRGQARVIVGMVVAAAVWLVWTRLRKRRITRRVSEDLRIAAEVGLDVPSAASTSGSPPNADRVSPATAPRARF
jgi:membrane protein DedA with SNARE-associated domain